MKIFTVLFVLWSVTAPAFTSVFVSRNANSTTKNVDKDVAAMGKEPEPHVHDISPVSGLVYERLVLFLYRDPRGDVHLYIPNPDKQAKTPDPKLSDDDILVPVKNPVLIDAFRDNPYASRIVRSHIYQKLREQVNEFVERVKKQFSTKLGLCDETPTVKGRDEKYQLQADVQSTADDDRKQQPVDENKKKTNETKSEDPKTIIIVRPSDEESKPGNIETNEDPANSANKKYRTRIQLKPISDDSTEVYFSDERQISGFGNKITLEAIMDAMRRRDRPSSPKWNIKYDLQKPKGLPSLQHDGFRQMLPPIPVENEATQKNPSRPWITLPNLNKISSYKQDADATVPKSVVLGDVVDAKPNEAAKSGLEAIAPSKNQWHQDLFWKIINKLPRANSNLNELPVNDLRSLHQVLPAILKQKAAEKTGKNDKKIIVNWDFIGPKKQHSKVHEGNVNPLIQSEIESSSQTKPKLQILDQSKENDSSKQKPELKDKISKQDSDIDPLVISDIESISENKPKLPIREQTKEIEAPHVLPNKDQKDREDGQTDKTKPMKPVDDKNLPTKDTQETESPEELQGADSDDKPKDIDQINKTTESPKDDQLDLEPFKPRQDKDNAGSSLLPAPQQEQINTLTNEELASKHKPITIMDVLLKKLNITSLNDFDIWIEREAESINSTQTIGFHDLKLLIIKILAKNRLTVSEDGIVQDHKGHVVPISDIIVRPIFIGPSGSLSGTNDSVKIEIPEDTSFLEAIMISKNNKVLGTIPLGVTVPMNSTCIEKTVNDTQVITDDNSTNPDIITDNNSTNPNNNQENTKDDGNLREQAPWRPWLTENILDGLKKLIDSKDEKLEKPDVGHTDTANSTDTAVKSSSALSKQTDELDDGKKGVEAKDKPDAAVKAIDSNDSPSVSNHADEQSNVQDKKLTAKDKSDPNEPEKRIHVTVIYDQDNVAVSSTQPNKENQDTKASAKVKRSADSDNDDLTDGLALEDIQDTENWLVLEPSVYDLPTIKRQVVLKEIPRRPRFVNRIPAKYAKHWDDDDGYLSNDQVVTDRGVVMKKKVGLASDDYLYHRIIGGHPAMGSGIPISNKGK